MLSPNESQTAMAMDLFERALPSCEELGSPRAIALALLGCVAYGSRFKGACAMIEACAEEYATTGDRKWSEALVTCFDWFLGRNDLRAPVVDFTTGGCRDGLGANGVNHQGTESTLSWLMSLIARHKCRATWGTVPAEQSGRRMKKSRK